MFHLWTLIPALYVCWRLIATLRFPLQVKVALAAIVILGCEYHFISRLAFGTMFSPELPAPLLLMLGWLFGTTLLLALLLLLRDAMLLMLRLLRRRLTTCRALTPAAVALAAGLAAIGVWQAARVPEVVTVDVTLPNLAAEFDGFTLVQLTDLHASRLLGHGWVAQVVAKTNALRPDLIVVTGDVADGTVSARQRDVQPLAALRAPLGVYAVTGNHEYYFNAAQWVAACQRLGMRFLSNQNVRFQRGAASLVVAGVTDDVAPEYGFPPARIADALQGVQPEDSVILLSHRPADAQRYSAAGVSLQLSGHTHGGMIAGADRLIAAANAGFVSGLYSVGRMQLYVSNGTGIWNGFPLRLGKPSEITLIRLRSGAAEVTAR